MENVKKKTSSRPIGQWSVSKTGGPCAIYKKPNKIQNSTFLLDQRYEVLEVLGSGAYGVVVSVIDHTTGEKLAIKKIEKAFDHPTFTKRTLRELKIMRLMAHENVLDIKQI
jgi:serine/threonine protein kinase